MREELSARVLIIDDEECVCSYFANLLSLKNYEVEYVLTGKSGLEKLQEEFFDLVILDLNLPDFDGTELFCPLLEIQPDIELVILTGSPSQESILQALNEGASAYIVKPEEPDEFIKTIEKCLKNRFLKMENQKLVEDLKVELKQREEIGVELENAKKDTEAVNRQLKTEIQKCQRTQEELEAFNKAMIGRENRIIELKEEVNRLCFELGKAPSYPPVWEKLEGKADFGHLEE